MPVDDKRVQDQAALDAAKAQAEKEFGERVDKEVSARLSKEREAIPEALRGKSVKDLVDMMLSGSAELEKERAKSADLEKRVPRGEPTAEERRAALEKEYWTDPISFIDRHVASRTKPLVEASFETQSKVMRETARRTINANEGDGEFEKREKRIDEIMSQLPPEYKASPQVWEATFNVALGEETRAQKKEARAKAGLHSETGGSGGGGGRSERPIPAKLRDLTRDQIEPAAKRFGMDYDGYVDWAEKTQG